MEKVALFELNPKEVKLSFVNLQKNKSYVIYKSYDMPLDMIENNEDEFIIRSNITKEVVNNLQIFKQMADREEVSEYICIANHLFSNAKNLNGFFNEISSFVGLKFEIMTLEEKMNNLYTITINSFNKPKGLIVNICEDSTEVILYNRRNLMESKSFPMGFTNMSKGFDGDINHLIEDVEEQTAQYIKDSNWQLENEEEFHFIGMGKVFTDLGKISRKAKRYPIDVEHNYELSRQDFAKVFDVIKNVDMTKQTKIKGVDLGVLELAIGFSIIEAILDKAGKDIITINKFTEKDGMLLKYALPITVEKPISDNLGYSLQVLSDFYDRKPNNCENVYNLSMILFKQLKVLHKLSRGYIRVLRVASYLNNVGLRVDYKNSERNAFNIILNSNIYSVTHNELILSCFVVLLTCPDNFSPALWVKYKDIVKDEDLDAVRKLAVILRLAKSLDITEEHKIDDITCDILGDSVIMKTISEKDASFEVKHAMRYGNDFKKSFGKNLEIL